MATTLTIGPLTRVEGHLQIEVTVDGQVRELKMENMAGRVKIENREVHGKDARLDTRSGRGNDKGKSDVRLITSDRGDHRDGVARPDKVEKVERPEKVEKIERPEKIEKIERPEKVEKIELPEKIERIEKPEVSHGGSGRG